MTARRIDQAAFDASTFSKNRRRLLEADVADEFFAAVVRQAKLRRYTSSDHFSVDGTLLEAWASHKSFKPKDNPPGDPPGAAVPGSVAAPTVAIRDELGRALSGVFARHGVRL